MSTRDIENQIKELYGFDMSEATISHITDWIIEHIDQWKSRLQEIIYGYLAAAADR